MGNPGELRHRMFPIFLYLVAVYVVSAAVFGAELYVIERHEPPIEDELRVTANIEDPTGTTSTQESPPQETETPETAKPDVTRRKRKKLIRRLHKLTSE